MKSMRYILIILFMISNLSCRKSNLSDKTSLPLDKIPVMLANQCAEWNKGHLEGFMSYYWKSDSLRFITATKDLQGWDSIYFNYKRSFPNLEDVGKLSFTDLKMFPLEGKLANVTGEWHIIRPKGDIGGKFSLICRYDSDHWVIIVDHTW